MWSGTPDEEYMAEAEAGSPESFPEFDAGPDPAPEPAPKEATPEPEKKDGDAPKEAPASPTDAEKKPTEGDGASDEEVPEPEAGPFKFAGRSFKDAAAAEHYLKSQEGRAKAVAKREADAAKRAADAEARLTEAINAANWYKAEFEKRAQPQETKPAAETTEKAKPWNQDPKLWADVRDLAEKEGIDAALYYALDKAQGHMSKEFEAKLDAALAPVKQAEAKQKVFDQATELFEAAAMWPGPDGKPYYPELHNEADFQSVMQNWRTLDPKIAFTEQGLDYAVLRHRANKAGTPAPKVPTPAPSGASEVIDRLTAEKNKPAEPLNGGGVPRQGDDDPKAKFKRDFANVAKPVTTTEGISLGFME